jgi:hypothetical protein
MRGSVSGANPGNGGTRFRLFPRPPYVHADWLPELVSVPTPLGLIGPGPSDDRMYLVNPIDKRRSYGVNSGGYGTPFLELPPWRGGVRRLVQPARDGHFDHIPVEAPEFAEVHTFGVIRFVLELWERHFGRRIEWHFARDLDRLEIVMLPELDNARAGYGFIEVGADHQEDGVLLPFALNFDVLAHELGHLIIYSTVGVPDVAAAEGEYFGFHECAADMTALIAAAHFNTLIERLLEDTHGNLYTFNELDRFAELSATTQIRLASNSVKMSQFAAGWTDEHALSEPLTGALFDIFVDIFQENLVERGVIAREIADLADHVGRNPDFEPVIQAAFDAVFPDARGAFHEALAEARDYMGMLLAETWKRLSPNRLRYTDVASALLSVDRMLSGGRYHDEIIESIEWREIGQVTVGPRLQPPDRTSHSFSTRTIVPEIRCRLPHMAYHERVLAAGRRASRLQRGKHNA